MESCDCVVRVVLREPRSYREQGRCVPGRELIASERSHAVREEIFWWSHTVREEATLEPWSQVEISGLLQTCAEAVKDL